MAPAVANLEFGGNVLKGDIMYQDEQCVVCDVEEDRQAPVHYRVVPRKALARLADATADDERLLGHLLLVARNIAVAKGLKNTGYHVMVDENHRTGTLNSLHVFERALHHMLWPTGPGSRL